MLANLKKLYNNFERTTLTKMLFMHSQLILINTYLLCPVGICIWVEEVGVVDTSRPH